MQQVTEGNRTFTVGVIRISYGGISGAQFYLYHPGMHAWASTNKQDRQDMWVKIGTPPTLEQIHASLDRVIAWFNSNTPTPEVVVITVPAPVHGNTIYHCNAIPFLAGTFLSDYLRPRIARPTYLNNTNAYALAELHLGAASDHKKIKSFLLVSCGRRLGSALVQNGILQLGDSGKAGEIGHLVDDDNGPECVCGRKGCIDHIIPLDAIKYIAGQRGICVENAAQCLQSDVHDIVARGKSTLVRAIHASVHTPDIHWILAGGSMFTSGAYDAQQIEQALNQRDGLVANENGYIANRFHVIPTQFAPDNGPLIGGAIIGFELLGADRPHLVQTEPNFIH